MKKGYLLLIVLLVTGLLMSACGGDEGLGKGYFDFTLNSMQNSTWYDIEGICYVLGDWTVAFTKNYDGASAIENSIFIDIKNIEKTQITTRTYFGWNSDTSAYLYDAKGKYYRTSGTNQINVTITRFENEDVQGSIEGSLIDTDDNDVITIIGSFKTIIEEKSRW